MKRLRWLLWKEYRHNRLIVIAGLVLLLLPYVVGFATLVRAPETPVWNILHYSGIASLYASLLTLVLLGGNSIAGERADRSAEFLFSLPFSRRELLAGKLLSLLVVVGIVCLVNVFSVLHVSWELAMYEESRGVKDGVLWFLVIGATMFGMAWFASSMSSSPLFSIWCGIVTPFVVTFSVAGVNWMLHDAMRPPRATSLALALCATIACFSFAAGTWRYLRRVEP